MSSQNIPLKAAQIPGIQPNSGHRDYSRLRCGVGETQLGPSARISAGVLTRTLVAAGYSGHTGSRDSPCNQIFDVSESIKTWCPAKCGVRITLSNASNSSSERPGSFIDAPRTNGELFRVWHALSASRA